MTYRSAVDWWLYFIIVAAAAATIPSTLSLIATRQPGQMLIGAAVLLLACLLPLWLLVSTYYRLDASALVVRSGPFRWTVPYAQIRTVEPSRSLLSSPALSLDRIRIDYGKGRTILVSPKDRAAFIAAIERQVAAARAG